MTLPVERSRILPNFLQQGIAIVLGWPWRLLASLGSLACLLALALLGYQASARLVTVVVDGSAHTLRTHHRLVGGVLRQAGLTVGPADQVYPDPESPWLADEPILLRRALPITVHADGRETELYGHPESFLEVFVRTDVTLRPNDAVYVNDERLPEAAYADPEAFLSLLAQESGPWQVGSTLPPAPALQVEVVRAVPLHVRDNGVDIEARATAETVGAALEEAGFRIFRADRVFPPLDTPMQPGLHVYILRALPLNIVADGRKYETRTWTETVGELLQEQDLILGPIDRVEPSPNTPLHEGMTVRVIRVTTRDQVEQNPIAFEYRQEPDPTMELDHTFLRSGEEGIVESVTRITYEDGQEVKRVFLGEQVVKEPADEVFFYGTRIVIRTLETPHGTIEYWRKLHVVVTHYFPSTCDKTPDHPLYGITYTGGRAQKGIIAVDPRYIAFHTRMYVPGYGFGVAEDIGGAIKGRHIDVCFPDEDVGKNVWSTRYLDIYLLTPVPPPERITWIIP
jgi:uncharacterized protein YabE (DUF348 family)